ncbi:MAG: DUF58 domain-containing protein [Chloroflexota bacterium]
MTDRRRTAIYAAIIGCLLAGLITGRGFFFNVAYAFAGLLVLSFVWVQAGISWLRLGRQTRARRAQVGRTLEERFTVQNTSLLPKLWLEVYDESTLPGHHASHVVSTMGPHAEKSWPVRTLCVQRGEFVLGPLRVVNSDPFGLFEVERQINATTRLVVYPSTVDVVQFALPVGLLPGGEAIRRRTHTITTNASGVREYAPGDSLSRIHWRSSARRERLIVKEFELDPLADIWIALDAEGAVHYAAPPHPADGDRPAWEWQNAGTFALPPTTEEYAVSSAASLAQYFLRKDRSVGFVTHGQRREVIQVDRGPRQLTKIMETLALFRADGHMPLDQLLTLEADQLARGTTLVVVTPSTREGWGEVAHRLAHRGVRVIAVLVDSESFGGRPGVRRVAATLAAINVPTYVVRRGDDLAVALSHQQV